MAENGLFLGVDIGAGGGQYYQPNKPDESLFKLQLHPVGGTWGNDDVTVAVRGGVDVYVHGFEETNVETGAWATPMVQAFVTPKMGPLILAPYVETGVNIDGTPEYNLGAGGMFGVASKSEPTNYNFALRGGYNAGFSVDGVTHAWFVGLGFSADCMPY